LQSSIIVPGNHWATELREKLSSTFLSHFKLDSCYQNIPERLFKYCRFDIDKHYINNLERNVVWLSKPDHLNDPYDCALTYSNQELYRHSLKKNVRQVIAKIQSDQMQFSEEEIKFIENSTDIVRTLIEVSVNKDASIIPEDKTKFTDIFCQVLNDEMEKIPKQLAAGSRESTILTSFTEKNDSIIMWSHYASNHSGFCIEYNFKELGQKNTTNILLYPVIYQDKLIDITKYLLTADDTLYNNAITLLAAITKSTEWEYEKEWRLLIPFGISKNEMNWVTPIPKAIYMGSKIDPNNEVIISEIARHKKIRLFKAEMVHDEFKITFKEVNA
jgi:hypothetical protein